MCSVSCLGFVEYALTESDVQGRSLLEVGSGDVNGSVRGLVGRLRPRSYTGVDLYAGKGVDVVCPAERLSERFGENVFEGVLSTEMLEHVLDWRAVVHQLKAVVQPGGWLILTTRSEGFPYHEHPIDHWRFSLPDLHFIFGDFFVDKLFDDPREPGVFLKAYKPQGFSERNLSMYFIHEIVPGTLGRLG